MLFSVSLNESSIIENCKYVLIIIIIPKKVMTKYNIITGLSNMKLYKKKYSA